MRKRYEIWDAHVKFEDLNQVETHPVIIWNETTVITIGYKITSTNRGDEGEEFRIKHWKESGLDHESSIRLRKVVRLEEKDFIRRRGILDERERVRLDLRLSVIQ